MKEICTELYRKTGDFIQGICHPKQECNMLLDAGLRWVRLDVPYPFDESGNVSQRYQEFLEQRKADVRKGLSLILITPYPKSFIEHGISLTNEEGLKEVSRICAYIARDYAGMPVCWQATNEMHIVHFRTPLNAQQAKEFVISCIRGLRQGNPSAAIGHNSVDYDWADLCIEIEKRSPCDYIGLDCYDGTWSQGGVDSYREKIDLLYQVLRKPVILMEFGFASLGGDQGFGQKEIDDYLHTLGFSGMTNALNRQEELLSVLPPVFARIAEKAVPEDREQCILSFFPHLLKKWQATAEIPHTEAGQAIFYEQLLPMLQDHPAVGGAVIYCWQDSQACFLCGENDCPCETAWGLIRTDGTPKPAYEVVKRIFNP